MTSNIQISGKAVDGRIYVIGGENFDEFFANLSSVFAEPGQAERVVEDFQFLVDPPSQPAYAAAAPLRAADPSPVPSSAPAPAPGAPTCLHGPRVFRSGTSAKGPWSAWFCPTPKGAPDQCKATWA